MKINYRDNIVSDEYRCEFCHMTGIKLWRQYSTFHPHLLCANCASKNQKDELILMQPDGFHFRDGDWTDQIGNYVPAVPDEEDLGYWGYTSVPEKGISWWQSLPME